MFVRGSESNRRQEDSMTVALEEFTQWRHGVEARLCTLEAASDTHAAKTGDHRGLLTAMDKDVSDAQAAFRAQLAVLNSVRETQSEHITVLREHTTALTELRAGQGGLRRELTEVRRELTEVRVGIRTIVGLLTPEEGNGEPGGDSPN
jgi:chromosome segregation ATPase